MRHFDLNEPLPSSPQDSPRHQFVNPIYDEWAIVAGHTKSHTSMDRSVDGLSIISTDSSNPGGSKLTSKRKSKGRALYDLQIHNLSYKV